MADDLTAVLRELGLSNDVVEILVNVLVVVKVQQLNIELLWEAYASGKPPLSGMHELTESNRRLAASMEEMVNALAAVGRIGNAC